MAAALFLGWALGVSAGILLQGCANTVLGFHADGIVFIGFPCRPLSPGIFGPAYFCGEAWLVSPAAAADHRPPVVTL